MMKKRAVVVLIIILMPLAIIGQYQIKDSKRLNAFEQIPKETTFIQYNDGLLVAGEYLYYKMYCLNASNLTPSSVSKIGYVELIGPDKNSVFTHKIQLIDGVGQGDFFIPATITTGNYKLIGYTRWMENKTNQSYFASDITIVNPFQELSTPSTKNPDLLKVIDTSSMKEKMSTAKVEDIEIQLPKKTFQKRELVSLRVLISNKTSKGSYALSVRKIYSLSNVTRQSAFDFAVSDNRKVNFRKFMVNDTVSLPELRGELVSGKLISTRDGNPVADKDIILSIPGKPNVLRLTKTDESGVFYFLVDEPSRASKAIIQTLGVNEEEIQTIPSKDSQVDYSAFEFESLQLREAVNSVILERSTYGQIENAYREQKYDSFITHDTVLPVYQNLTENYILDDYTRFRSLKETVVEVIPDLLLKKIKGIYKFQVRINDNFFVEKVKNPLVIVDGVFLQDMDKLLNFDQKKIERISIGRNQYYIGPKMYQGIVEVATKKNDFWNTSNLKGTSTYDINAPLTKKLYYKQTYTTNKQSNEGAQRIPDFRNQLVWEPNLELIGAESNITFYTSDNSGTYEIILEGFTNAGKAISANMYFTVE